MVVRPWPAMGEEVNSDTPLCRGVPRAFRSSMAIARLFGIAADDEVCAA
jgi:hypothetical protein